MEQRRSMNDIIVHRKDEHPLLQNARPRRSIREITRENREHPRRGEEVALGFDTELMEERRKEERRHEEGSIFVPQEKKREEEAPKEDFFAEDISERHTRRPMGMWTLAFFSSLVLVFAASTYFYGAKVKVVPTQNTITVSEKLMAYTDTRAGGVQFTMVTLSDEKSVVVKASGEENVDKKASGSIVIFNAYSDKPQRLIKNTRFENTDGKVYRIDTSVTVPGASVSAGKQMPGQIEATVYADAAGVDYNIGLTDFTIPGFKGDPRYSKIFARSKTEMAGGFSGKMKVVSDADRTTAINKLKSELHEALLTATRAQAPQGYVLLDGVAQVTFTEVQKEGEDLKDDEALVTLSGKLTGALVSTVDLAQILAEGSLVSAGYDATKHRSLVSLDRPETLILTPDQGMVFTQDTREFKFTIGGDAHFVWKVDGALLARDIAGTPLKSFNAFITQAYPSVGRAEASRRPFWAFWIADFPENAKRIKVIVEDPKGVE